MKNARLTPALIAIDALLAIVLAALWLAPGPAARWRDWQTPAPQAPNLDDARSAQLAPNPALRRDYPAIDARPLFAVDRKPHVAASDAADAAPPPESIDQAKLYGLVDGPSAQGALVEQGGQPQFVRVGEKIGEWTLQAIDGRNAVFVKDGGERRAVPLPDSLTSATNAPVSAPTAAASAARPAMPAHPAAPPRRPGMPPLGRAPQTPPSVSAPQ